MRKLYFSMIPCLETRSAILPPYKYVALALSSARSEYMSEDLHDVHESRIVHQFAVVPAQTLGPRSSKRGSNALRQFVCHGQSPIDDGACFVALTYRGQVPILVFEESVVEKQRRSLIERNRVSRVVVENMHYLLRLAINDRALIKDRGKVFQTLKVLLCEFALTLRRWRNELLVNEESKPHYIATMHKVHVGLGIARRVLFFHLVHWPFTVDQR